MRLDGSGGDGGRDVLLRTDDDLTIFDLKAFTGQISQGGRKQQIAGSLARAATHEPVQWNLVVPIDPTPKELEWFEELTAQYRFESRWLGKTWLDDRHAQHPDLYRYFVDGAEARFFGSEGRLPNRRQATLCQHCNDFHSSRTA